MKKAAVAAAGVLTALFVWAGFRTEGTAADAPKGQEDSAQEQAENISGIDTSVPVQAGARIAVVSKNVEGEFWDRIRDGMEQAVSDVNAAYGFEDDRKITMTFEGPDDEQKVEEQINILDAVIAENPSAVCLSVGDMNSCQAQLEAAAENGIPVVAFDSNVSDAALIWAFRGTDNVQVGALAAGKLEEAIGGSGKAAVFSVQEKTQSARERTESFLSNLPAEVEVVEVVYADQVNDMEAAMQGALHIHPDLAGVFCSNADIAERYLNMDKDADQLPVMIGVDATGRQVEAVQNGEEAGIISQNPYMMGYETMLAAIQATVPERPGAEESVLYQPVWLDMENLDDARFADYIY